MNDTAGPQEFITHPIFGFCEWPLTSELRNLIGWDAGLARAVVDAVEAACSLATEAEMAVGEDLFYAARCVRSGLGALSVGDSQLASAELLEASLCFGPRRAERKWVPAFVVSWVGAVRDCIDDNPRAPACEPGESVPPVPEYRKVPE